MEKLSDIAGEESEEPCVDTVDDGCEVSRVVEEVDFVDVDHHHLALVLLEDELLVAMVEIGEILYLDGFFIFPAPFLDILHEVRDRGSEIDHEVGIAHHLHHRLEEFHVGLVVGVAHVSHGLVVGGKHIDTLEDRPVLYDGTFGVCYLENVAEAFFEEVDLECERPSVNIVVVVFQVRVMRHRLKLRCPSVMFGQHSGEGGFPAPYVACYSDVHVMQFEGGLFSHFVIFPEVFSLGSESILRGDGAGAQLHGGGFSFLYLHDTQFKKCVDRLAFWFLISFHKSICF